MGRKPVYEIDAKRIIDFNSDFGHKKLCDGFTFSLGSICVYSCSFCYVIPMILKLDAIQLVKKVARLAGKGLEDVVVRRRNAIKILRRQLTIERPAHVNLKKKAVIYTSPLVDPAANMALVEETAVACRTIFELTNWDVRVLSKSSFLPQLAKLIPAEFKDRMIYGFSTGTFDDDLCKSFEEGTALVSKRIEALHWLQDNGHRSFGMLCPILPQKDYDEYAKCAVKALRLDLCEHIWAEAINLRGDSFPATCEALEKGGFHGEAERLRRVFGPGSGETWEQYSRDAFEALARHIPPEKLRFLQYAKPAHAEWWIERESKGAILLGKAFISKQ
jgi:DNA repair photolyase